MLTRLMRMIFLMTLITLRQGTSAPCQSKDRCLMSLPKIEPQLAGSNVLIPCNFTLPEGFEINESEFISAMWVKGGSEPDEQNVVFNSAQNTTKGFERIEIPGNLHQRNCTTIFYNVQSNHTDKYFFRIQTPALNHTFSKDLGLKIKGYPLVSGPSEVAEGTSVTLTCTAAPEGHCCTSQSLNITWSFHTGNISTHIDKDKKNGKRNLTSFLTFTASRSHHERKILCTVSCITQNQNTLKAVSPVHTLKVKFSPEVVEASVSPSGAVAEGSSVTLTCNSSEANPPVHDYTWFRDTQTSPVGSGPNITFNVSSSHAGLYYCRAEHPQGGKESNRVELKVTDSFHPIFMIALGGCLGGFLLCAGTGIALGIKRWKVLQQNEQCSIPQDSSVHGKDGPAHTSAPNPTKDHLEEIQYGQISFSRPPLGDRGEGTGQQGLGLAQAPESVYAKVTLSGREGQARYQKAPNTQDLYAQVKRK